MMRREKWQENMAPEKKIRTQARPADSDFSLILDGELSEGL
jgi:hypothetical protein